MKKSLADFNNKEYLIDQEGKSSAIRGGGIRFSFRPTRQADICQEDTSDQEISDTCLDINDF